MAEIRCTSCGNWFYTSNEVNRRFCDECGHKIGLEQQRVSQEVEGFLREHTPWISRDNADSKIAGIKKEIRPGIEKQLLEKTGSHDRYYRIRCPGCGIVIDEQATEDYRPDLCDSCKRQQQERATQRIVSMRDFSEQDTADRSEEERETKKKLVDDAIDEIKRRYGV